MSSHISADFDQMLENIRLLVNSIEAAGVGSRSTDIDGLRTNTTATYLEAASAYTAGLEKMIANLAADTASFRDALKAELDEKQASEQNLSSALSQIEQIVDDPRLTPTTVLDSGGAPVVATDEPVEQDGEGGF